MEEGKKVALVLGTMTIGKQTNEEDAEKILDYFYKNSKSIELDTALM